MRTWKTEAFLCVMHKGQNPLAPLLQGLHQNSHQRGRSTHHVSKGSSNYAVGLCGLSSIWPYRMRSHSLGQHSIKAPHEGWRKTFVNFKKCKACFSQEYPRHSSLNPQERRMDKISKPTITTGVKCH